MSMPPQKFREIVFQILYSYDVTGDTDEEIIPLLMKELSVSRKSVIFAKEMAAKVLEKRAEIDAKISGVSTSYDFDRIQSVERNVLRLGVYELLFQEDLPPKVAIAEALRICRKFTSPEAASFVNAILDAIYKRSLGESVEDVPLKGLAKALEESERRAQQAANEPRSNDDKSFE